MDIRNKMVPASTGAVIIGLLACAPCALYSQPPAAAGTPDTTAWTTKQDHQNMMDQLGIKALRPGPSGNENAPDHANYDESKANPFSNIPDVLKLKNGKQVKTAKDWWQKRRPEIVEDFEREVIGRVPKNVPKVTWNVTETREMTVGKTAAVGKQLQGVVDNSAYPAIEVKIQAALVVPKEAKGPVPVMIMFGGGTLPRLPGQAGPAGPGGFGGPGGPGAGRGPGAPGQAPGAARGAAGGPPAGAGAGRAAAPMGPSDPPASEQLLAAGWGYVMLNPGSVQADSGAGLTKGIIGLTNHGQPRKPEDWGSLRAWAWGAARVLDFLETEKSVDAKHVGIDGVSRYGKAALVTMAFEPRFAVVLIGSSGEGGAKLHRRNFGEAVENLTGSGEYHWMAGNFLKYGASEATFGSKNPGDLPVDSHELLALCAPRATFVSYGVPERGDAKWLDQQGSWMAAVLAQPVFRLLGARDLGVKEDYKTAKMPAVNQGLLDGELAWRQHDGGHTDGPNWKYFIPWANKMFASAPKAAK